MRSAALLPGEALYQTQIPISLESCTHSSHDVLVMKVQRWMDYRVSGFREKTGANITDAGGRVRQRRERGDESEAKALECICPGLC